MPRGEGWRRVMYCWCRRSAVSGEVQFTACCYLPLPLPTPWHTCWPRH